MGHGDFVLYRNQEKNFEVSKPKKYQFQPHRFALIKFDKIGSKSQPKSRSYAQFGISYRYDTMILFFSWLFNVVS